MQRLPQKIAYFASGLTGRIGTTPYCPACGGRSGEVIDRKWLHSLIECQACRLLHRYPTETADKMSAFYDSGYAEAGLTTELPDDLRLQELIRTGFKDSGKDFTYHGELLRALGLEGRSRLLDYGANWGYASWQFSRQGFDVASFEISRPRAAFGEKLGLKIHTNIACVGNGFDVVYSCHVLEHTPNPGDVLRQQLGLVRPGGFVVAHTPNGSLDFRKRNPSGFNSMWGLVHPVLLTDRFVHQVAGSGPCFISSDDRPQNVASWDQATQVIQGAAGAGLFFVIKRPG